MTRPSDTTIARVSQGLFFRFLSVAAFVAPSVAILSGCGARTLTADSIPLTEGCKNHEAVVSVYDGFFINLCGCAESANQVVAPPTSMTCTVPAGTTLFFTYLSPNRPAQIFSLGQPSFVSSRPYVPEDKARTRSFSYTFYDVGTYRFENSYNQSMVGEIVVQ